VRILGLALLAGIVLPGQVERFGVEHERALAASQRLMKSWLRHADAKTMLLPDRPLDVKPTYTPHNSGADLYPYLILTARLTDPDLYAGRMREMLRNEIRYTTAKDGVPGNLELKSGVLGPASLFGAGEYAKDGLITVTEYLGRTPWTDRMADMVAAAMERAPVDSRFGKLPAADSELNGDYLQVLPRLYLLTGDARYLEWGWRIADAYLGEVLPGNFGLPSMGWDIEKHSGDRKLKLRDHGNEVIVGLVTQFALEHQLGTARAGRMRPVLARMFDRLLLSANADGMFFNTIDTETLKPLDERLSDNWGYLYGAMYTFYQVTGDEKYREAVLRVLRNLPKYRNWCWEPSGNALKNARKDAKLGSFDGYADAIESAIYLVNREAVPEALAWIDSEMEVMLSMQRGDGQLEDWYGEGNFNRTALLWGLMKSQGLRAAPWRPGLRLGAVREGDGLRFAVSGTARVEFDFARHRRVHNWQKNYVRLNEFPEWFTVEENRLYTLKKEGGAARVVAGFEFIDGMEVEAGTYLVTPMVATGN
jgi:hypothetical protein